jgi:transposase
MGTVSADRWRISDELWAMIEPLLPPPPFHPLGCHRPRVENRRAMDAIFFVLRTGCQWNALNATGICTSSSAHRRFQEWVDDGVFERLWAACLEAYDDQVGIDWLWQALDGAMTKAPLGRGKNRAQSDRPRQAGRQTQSARRWRGRPAGVGDRRREPARLPVA